MRILIIKSKCAQYCRKVVGLTATQPGQALPIVLAMVALGAMVIGPFLSMASSSVIGSRVFGQSFNETYAAGAGVEQAIWQLKYGTLAAAIPNTGNSTSYTLSDSVNNLYPAVTVTRSADSGGSQLGTITKSINDTLQFDPAGYTPAAINIIGNIFVVVFRDASNQLIIKSIAILADGTISNTVIDSLTVSAKGYEPAIIPLSTSVVAIVYRGPSNKGYVATVGIDSSGNIGSDPINNLVFANSNCYEPEIANVSGTNYAVVYRGPSNKGYVNTLQIAATGVVNNAQVGSYNFAAACYEPDIIAVTGTYYALVYRGTSNRGNITTISINSNGVITQNVVSTAIINNTAAYWTKIEKIASGIFATVYRGPSNDGYITTSQIDANGTITTAIIDTWVFDTTRGYEPSLIAVSGNAYAIVYRGNNADGYIETLTIDSGGTITQLAIDSYRFDTSNGYEPNILHISGDIYALVYRGGTGTIGYVKTLNIVTSGTNLFQITSIALDTTITTSIQIDTGVVKVLSWQITK